jgi:lipoprotein-releasing system ATP-binding protein
MIIASLLDVVKSYEQPVLQNVTLNIPEGSSTAIIGPSGSGKSTLLHLLGTLDKPDAGKIMIDGREVLSMEDKSLAQLRNRFIGFVFQMHYLLPQLNLQENILLPTIPIAGKNDQMDKEKRAGYLMERVGIEGLKNKFPGELSVGECQRGAVVRALINEPRLLLADEPTGSLDQENARKLTTLLVDLQKEQNMAMVVVTHDPSIGNRMEKQYYLQKGNLELSQQS